MSKEFKTITEEGESFSCPYCNQTATLTSANAFTDMWSPQGLYEKHPVVCSDIVICPNAKCRRITLRTCLAEYEYVDGVGYLAMVNKEIVLPGKSAKQYPTYVPESIRKSYEEGFAILQLSPTASATLSRRCLQGMIRDFHKVNVKSGTLYDEIDAIKSSVSVEEWEAMDATRKIGNVGAHMKADVNTVFDVEQEEADALIWLIEYLIDGWYIRKHDEKERLKQIKAMGDAKVAKK